MQVINPAESKPALFEEISPNWANRLQNRKIPVLFSPRWIKWYFELDSPSRCIVGEAYGYSSQYENKCKICDEYGWKFGHAFLIRSIAEIQNNINMFVSHWNRIHRIG